MNYYAEWWENARKQSGTILTKPTYLKQLEKELAELKANPNYQHLASELAQWKAKYEKVKVLEANLTIANENLAKLKTEAENTQKAKETELKELASKYSEIKNLGEKRLAEQKQEYEQRLNHATHNQASILKTSLFKETEVRELDGEISRLKEQLVATKIELRQIRNKASVYQAKLRQIKSSETDQQRELQERGKLIIKLENIIKAQQGEVSLASSKSKHLQIIFSQIITTVNKGIFVRKKELKETLSQISELMEWKGMASVVSTASGTPAEPIITETNIPTIKETAEITEPSEADKNKLKKLKNISVNFTTELISQWESKGFSYEQTADWINTGFKPTEAEYAWWLAKGVGYDPLKYLNETSSEEQADLKKQFEEYKQRK